MTRPMRPIRILSIDGGGMRGIIPALLLQRLEQLLGKRLDQRQRPREPLANFFDVVAGTSTGAILAAGLAGCSDGEHPLAEPATLIEFYRKDGAQVFAGERRRIWLPAPARRIAESMRGFLTPKFATGQQRLRKKFEEICGEARLPSAVANLVIPAFTGNGPFVFRGGPDWPEGSQPDYFLRDVLLATTAAPYLFPPARVAAFGQPVMQSFVDGGLFANNPALHAYLDARELFGDRRDILLVSLGTASDFHPIDYHKARNWGAYGWLNPQAGLPLIQAMMQGHSQDIHRNLQRLIPNPNWYLRFDIRSPAPLPTFDDASPEALQLFERIGDEIIRQNEELLEDLADRLVRIGPKRYQEEANWPPRSAHPEG
jgi:uncharacterized protein